MVVGCLTGKPLLLDREGTTSFLDLAIGGRAGLLGLPLRGGTQVVGLLVGGQPNLFGLAFGRRQQVLGLALRQGPFLRGIGEHPAAVLLHFLELDHPDVLGLAGGIATDRPRVLRRLVTDLAGLRDGVVADLLRLLLGQPQHRARPAAQSGVRRGVVLGELLLQVVELRLELRDPLFGSSQTAAESAFSFRSWRRWPSTASLS